MKGFFEALAEQRWDDHRYYHHSRINQSLHLVSAMQLPGGLRAAVHAPGGGGAVRLDVRDVHPPGRPLLLRAEGLRRGRTRRPTSTRKQVKVGYNLRRKVILHSVWGLAPLVLYVQPTLFGLFQQPARDLSTATCSTCRGSGSALAGGALLFRTIHLFFLRDVQTGLVWFTKILTDPFHDIMLYHKAPLYLMRGELIEPEHA